MSKLSNIYVVSIILIHLAYLVLQYPRARRMISLTGMPWPGRVQMKPAYLQTFLSVNWYARRINMKRLVKRFLWSLVEKWLDVHSYEVVRCPLYQEDVHS